MTKTKCSTCHKNFLQPRPAYRICFLCHVVLLLKTFPVKAGRERSGNCFVRAYDEHVRLKVKAATA